MSDAVAAAVTETAPVAAPPSEEAQADAIAALLDPLAAKKSAPIADKTPTAAEKSSEKAAEKGKDSKEPDHLAAANGRKPPKEPEDPLDEADFAPEKLDSPEAIKGAAERVVKARRQAAEFMRASHRSHAAAEKREHKLTEREQAVIEREKRAAIIERAQSEKDAALDELTKGDADNFLTAVAKLRNTTDPVGFWKACTVAIASGKPVPAKQQAQADANPELAARLERLEQHLTRGEEQSFEAQREALKDQNLQAAKANAATPRVVAYASDERAAGAIRERLAEIMLSEYRQHGRPIDISRACEILESELSVHYELSQRSNGTAQAQTNRENGTTGSGPDAGRETSKDLPKPETAQATIPASLSSAPASASRPMNEDELRDWQIRQLDAVGFFD